MPRPKTTKHYAKDTSASGSLESQIEKSVVNYARSVGVMCYKNNSPKGAPDRAFYKDGRCIFIEFKPNGKKLP